MEMPEETPRLKNRWAITYTLADHCHRELTLEDETAESLWEEVERIEEALAKLGIRPIEPLIVHPYVLPVKGNPTEGVPLIV